MKNYIYKCYLCGKEFNLYKGEGCGESYLADDQALLPKTRYVCIDCIKKGKE